MNLDRYIGAGDGTNPAPYTAGGLNQLGVEVTLDADLFRHRQDTLGAGLYAQLTTFAVILVYRNAGH